MNIIKETIISTEVFDATWTGIGWGVEIANEIEGTVWRVLEINFPQRSICKIL